MAYLHLGATDSDDKKRAREAQPRIRGALKWLANAKWSLENAAHDFKGHRVAALARVEEAIRECQEALRVDVR